MKKFNEVVLLALLAAPYLGVHGQIITDTAHTSNYRNINELVVSKTDSGYVVAKKKSVIIPPSFVGGRQALQLYLQANIKYPRIIAEKGITGTVLVKFTVDSSGTVINPTLVKKVHYDLDTEALRVISTLPDWNPATKDGKPVNMDMAIPIEFKRR